MEEKIKTKSPASDNIIELKNVYKSYDGKPVVKNLTLGIKRGEFVTLLGPSGCGKTTTLRMIAGFEQPSQGAIFFNGQDITDLPPHKRNINTVFQKYALFPHLTVFGNIAFGLKMKLVPNGEPFVYMDVLRASVVKCGIHQNTILFVKQGFFLCLAYQTFCDARALI